jgi:hypothetical protein
METYFLASLTSVIEGGVDKRSVKFDIKSRFHGKIAAMMPGCK